MQSIAGSTIFTRPVPQALIRGLKMCSESASEYSTEPPSLSGPGTEEESGSGFCGEFRRSMTDLHSAASLECLRHEAFLTIFSRDGVTTRLNRESTSEEAIPKFSRRAQRLNLAATDLKQRPRNRVDSEI